MQFSELWLRTFCNPPIASDELAHALTMAGLEVEDSQPVAPASSGVVVGQVLAVARHPNADRLTVCTVDAGTGSALTIVCGAPNVAAGLKVPCALVGAVLPPAEAGGEPFAIRRATMRGVESHGMLCSARELRLSDDHSGLLILDAEAPVGADIRTVLGLDDRLLTLKLTPNKADCLSLLGVGREVAAITGSPLHAPRIPPVPAASDATFPVTLSAPDGCGRFTGRVIRNVNAKASTPQWMIDRLARSGQRAISALVDVTNYVMLELGRPLHVYDLAKLAGGIDVRYGRPGETVKLLNEQVVSVDLPDLPVLCITDASGPIGLAGIMGGDSTKAELDTRDIFLESAFFFPNAIAGRARRYNFTSDASHRFERGVDFDNNVDGIERATQLILDICGGEAGPTVDTIAALPQRKPVRLRVARAAKVLGIPVNAAGIADVFTRLALPFLRESDAADADFIVRPPSHRFDLEIEEDLIEEVARIHGFDNIPAHPPVTANVMLPTNETVRSVHAVRHLIADLDYQEVVNFSFVDEASERDFATGDAAQKPIRLLNPIASQMSVMRSTLLSGLVGNIAYNVKRKAPRVRVFELGKVYLADARAEDEPLAIAGYRQPLRVAGAAFGPAVEEQWGSPTRAVDFFDVKRDVEALLGHAAGDVRFVAAAHPAFHPGRSARIEHGGEAVGWIGALHPRLVRVQELPSAPVLFELEWAALQRVPLPSVGPVSRFPPVRRDLAVVVDERHPAQVLLESMREAAPTSVSDIRLFDVYRGPNLPEGKKSLAFLVLMQDTQRTLTDPEIDAAMEQIMTMLRTKFDGTTR